MIPEQSGKPADAIRQLLAELFVLGMSPDQGLNQLCHQVSRSRFVSVVLISLHHIHVLSEQFYGRDHVPVEQ